MSKRSASFRPRGISRREFIKLAAMAGLLAGCGPIGQPVVTPAPTATPTKAPPPTPSVPNKVVHTHHAGVWSGDDLVTGALRQMLDASITKLTGLDDATAAWASLFDPGERIAIKINTINTSDFWTHMPLVVAVTERLQETGVPAEQIVIFDRATSEMKGAGYTINQDGPGVRCHGTDRKYSGGWTVMETDVGLSDILMNCDALINMPILKVHTHSGVTFAMKNHFGTFDRPGSFHRPRTGPAIVELNALAPIRDRTRLIIGDALEVSPVCMGAWVRAVTGDSILMSFDPVAHDTVGLQVLGEVMRASGEGNPAAATDLASAWLEKAAELGLGTNNPDNIELVEVSLG